MSITSDERVSFAEELLWRVEQDPARAIPFVECPRHFPIALRLRNALDVDALVRSLAEIVQRHGPLRSTFVMRNGELVRVTAPSIDLQVKVDESTTVPDVGERSLESMLLEDIVSPFDLARGPLVRARILKLGEHDHLLLIVLHHIVFDGWSMRVLLRELGALYGRFTGASAAPLPPPSRTYADYVAWQKGRLQSERVLRAVAFWREQLRGCSGMLLPADRPRGADVSIRSGTERFVVPAETTQALKRLSQTNGVTLAITIAALFDIVLAAATGSNEVVCGMPLADRNRGEFDELIGLFLNLAIVRTDLRGDPTFVELLTRVRKAFTQAYDHSDVPYSHLLKLQGTETAASLARVVFNFVNVRGLVAALPGLDVRNVPIDGEPPSVADLSVHVIESAGMLSGRLLYKTDLFDPERIQALVRRFEALIPAVLEDPRVRVGSIGAAERANPVQA